MGTYEMDISFLRFLDILDDEEAGKLFPKLPEDESIPITIEVQQRGGFMNVLLQWMEEPCQT